MWLCHDKAILCHDIVGLSGTIFCRDRGFLGRDKVIQDKSSLSR